jgi:Cu2+-exporting ATPase
LSASPDITVKPSNDAVPRCYHCDHPIHGAIDTYAEIDGVQRPMCCKGCKTAAEVVVAGGLDDDHRQRARLPATPEELESEFLREARVYDHEDTQRSFVRRLENGEREASLILGGIECAGCASLNERHLQQLPGVVDAQVNFSTHRANVRWVPELTRLSDILTAVKRIGYSAHPYDPDRQEALLDAERRQQLRRLGVAGALGMQVMMIAVALYAGEWYGIGENFRRLFLWLSLALTIPVLLYSARPFFGGALRDLRNRRLGMDVPVSLGLGIAFLGSVHATVAGVGAVYYDSVVMFVFFLLLARYLELMARKRSAQLSEALVHPAPVMATRVEAAGEHSVVPVAELVAGDRVLVRPGAQIPADGRVLEGRASVDEALLTGESRPVVKDTGDCVIGGSINLDSPLEILVERTGPDTILSRILDLVERARNERPYIQHLADRVATYFVGAVLMLACATAIYWWQAAPERWLPITVAMLVITCPCALSLATPTAIAAATGALTRRALIVTGSDALETLAKATRFVFDKTGTLTHGRPRVSETVATSDIPLEECARIAAALERSSEHPVAKALVANTSAGGNATGAVNTPGGGLQAKFEGTLYTIGTPTFVESKTGYGLDSRSIPEDMDEGCSLVLLADATGVRCAFYLNDAIRSDARRLVASLHAQGTAVSLYSGDRYDVTAHVADEIGIDDVAAGLSPEDKLRRVRELQARGEVVAMMGDGVNDTPVLSGADVSIAMGDGAQAARANGDMILIGNDLSNLAEGVGIARRTLSVIRQNLLWAVAYNLLAIPAAAAGFVAPWMAAIGMSASSLLVVANSLRLNRRQDSQAEQQ